MYDSSIEISFRKWLERFYVLRHTHTGQKIELRDVILSEIGFRISAKIARQTLTSIPFSKRKNVIYFVSVERHALDKKISV